MKMADDGQPIILLFPPGAFGSGGAKKDAYHNQLNIPVRVLWNDRL